MKLHRITVTLLVDAYKFDEAAMEANRVLREWYLEQASSLVQYQIEGTYHTMGDSRLAEDSERGKVLDK